MLGVFLSGKRTNESCPTPTQFLERTSTTNIYASSKKNVVAGKHELEGILCISPSRDLVIFRRGIHVIAEADLNRGLGHIVSLLRGTLR